MPGTSRDRRRFKRFDLILNLGIKPTKEEYLLGTTINFSRKGLSFISEVFDPSPPETIELELQHPMKGFFVSVLGDIVWKTRIDDRCYAGITLRNIDTEVKSEILDYAYEKWTRVQRSFQVDNRR